jgi:putative PIN family toxin of toxin-antitoxin system
MARRVVLDTNVIVAALRSQRGAAARVLQRVGTGAFEHVLSVALILEYEAVCRRPSAAVRVDREALDDVLDFLAQTAIRQPIHFLWRPTLRDPSDDHVLDLAVAAQASIVTYNRRDFRGAEEFGVEVLTPAALLRRLPPEETP